MLYPLEKEDVISIESKTLRLGIGQESSAIRSVTLKEFLDDSKKNPLHISGNFPLVSTRIGEKPLSFSVVSTKNRQLTLSAEDEKKNLYTISYAVIDDSYTVRVNISQNAPVDTEQSNEPNVSVVETWVKSDKIANRYNMLEVFSAVNNGGEQYAYKKYHVPSRNIKNVPRGTSIISLSERYFCESIKPLSKDTEIKILPSPDGVAATSISYPRASANDLKWQFDVYFGPRDYFYLRGNGFEKAIPIGVIGQIGLIMLMVLGWIGQAVHNYGVAIILFSILITVSMSPLTVINFRSMRRLQEVKPHVDRIMEKHKKDQMKANQEIFALYREKKINPLSGCLPMLLQMPILIALFQAMSHFIQLRGKTFLWIRDLSLPDRAIHIPVTLPIIGADINVLPVIMAGAMYLQTKMSQSGQPSDQSNPTAKMMSGPFMPILFCLMFYNFPAGLVLYWLTNSLMSLAVYQMVK